MLIAAKKHRTCSFTATMLDADGDNVVIASGDVVRFKIGNTGKSPLLDLDSAADSANGSSVSAANPTTIELNQDDLDTLQPGIYDTELSVVDDSDGDKIKHVQSDVIHIQGTPTGDVALS